MKKILAILLAIAMIAAMAACAQKAAPADETKTSGETTSTAGETVDNTAEDTADTASSESYKIFLITMDQMDQYWTNIDAGCKKAAEELGNVEYQPRGGQRCAEGSLRGWRADRLRRFPGKLYAVCCDVQHR